MKFLIATVVLVSTTTFSDVNAADYTFQNLLRTEIVSPPNDVLSVTSSADESYDTITYLKQIDQYDSILIKGKMTYEPTGETVTSGGSWNLCNFASLTEWDKFAMTLLRKTLVPRASRNKWCPVEPQESQSPRFLPTYGARVGGDAIPLGNYKLEYSAISSTGQDVFTSVVYTFSLKERPYQVD